MTSNTATGESGNAQDAAHELDAESCWRDFCSRMAEAGAAALADPLIPDDRHRAEGLRHLSRQLVFATQHAVEFGDAEFPSMHRFNDDVTPWGGPSADNHYLRCAIDPDGLYRLSAEVTGCRDAILSLGGGEFHLDQHRTSAELGLRDFHVDDGLLEVMIGPPGAGEASSEASQESADADKLAPNWMQTNPDVTHLLIRVYVSDWTRDAVPDFYVERLDGLRYRPEPLTIDRMAAALDEAANWVELSLPFWLRLMKKARQRSPGNTLAAPRAARGGAEDIAYGGGFWRLGEGDAWLIEFKPPETFAWSIQAHTWPWFESGDPTHSQTSVNHVQAHVDTDGRVRAVVSHQDPGVPNWIDTEGRTEGLCIHRWVRATTMPVARSFPVPLDELREHLPEDHPVVTPEQRREHLAARRRGVHRRFRR